MQRTSIPLTALLLLGVVSAADAQIAPPTGTTGGLFGRRRPVDPNAVTQQVTMTVDLAAGHDTISPMVDEQGLPSIMFLPQFGTVTSAAAAVDYRWGTSTTFIGAAGQGAASYATAGVERIRSASGSVSGALGSRERHGITGAVTVAYEPAFLFGAFAPLGAENPDSAFSSAMPGQGVTGQPWLSTDGSVGAYRRWTQRQRSEVRYSAVRREPLTTIDGTMGGALTNSNRIASVRHDWVSGRTLTLDASYDYWENRQDVMLGVTQRLRTHRGNAGFSVLRRLSPSRTLALRLAGGVAHSNVNATAVFPGGSFVVPTVAGSARINLTRSWIFGINAARDVNVLQGLTPEPFTVNMVAIQVGGNVAPRVQLSTTAGYTRGSGRGDTIGLGSFENLAGSLQAQFALARQAALFVSYQYYDHRLTDITIVQPGFPLRQERNGIRVGMTFWLPIVGTF